MRWTPILVYIRCCLCDNFYLWFSVGGKSLVEGVIDVVQVLCLDVDVKLRDIFQRNNVQCSPQSSQRWTTSRRQSTAGCREFRWDRAKSESARLSLHTCDVLAETRIKYLGNFRALTQRRTSETTTIKSIVGEWQNFYQYGQPNHFQCVNSFLPMVGLAFCLWIGIESWRVIERICFWGVLWKVTY